jgi:hypothetical protein
MNAALYFFCSLLAVLCFNPHVYSQQLTAAGQVGTAAGSNQTNMIKGVDNLGICVTDLSQAVLFTRTLVS